MTTIRRRRRQRGAVLIISLIMLAVMSLFVISMLRTSILELKIGGASHAAQLNFANAELALNKWIADNNGRIAPNFLSNAALGAGCNVNTAGLGPCNDPPTVFGGTVAVTPTQIMCGASSAQTFGNSMESGLQLSAVRFNLRAVATGTLGGTTIVNQGIESLAAAGAC